MEIWKATDLIFENGMMYISFVDEFYQEWFFLALLTIYKKLILYLWQMFKMDSLTVFRLLAFYAANKLCSTGHISHL